ncbi:carbohydrate ABC transporter substrate-binding protein (CUT1 family) [Mucilaginibacter gracilis]|uniref:Carbohydrate ABC transporter substrate-binding protein (CUT1 family) n=1 Tax=Mucilaginibacter gracilis TaxID=423350 RepID=A0A495J6M9_9SPHI|nr:extracellular solute-binding protein [Mucilaginibacter gracilis]RKR84371.1 carbohydrate ABC transporter substrate-binding protein (CUT1 family) [Mucilaginibacter gracilis]
MLDNITLKGITWNHSRGFVPMTATAQRFAELNPLVNITWEKRSLQQFADLSIQQLAERYDLLVIDHPWAGFAAKTGSILPFDKYLSKSFLQDQEANTVGHSYESYSYDGHQWALAIDAATPVAASRPDLFKKYGLELPKTYNDLLALAKRGLVAFPAIPIDSLMTFYTFCCSLGEDPCQQEDKVISEATGIKALQLYRELAQNIDVACFNKNPIQIYETMTLGDDIAYCPFAYGYSNYSRNGYARQLLHFHDMITLNGSSNLRSSLGGTGIAISSNCKHVDIAMQYAQFVASPACQLGLYTHNGGQPGHLTAWTDAQTNQITHNYFANTLPALQRAYLRPRYFGHMFFQDHAGDMVRNYLMNGGDEREVLKQMDDLYLQSKQKVQA